MAAGLLLAWLVLGWVHVGPEHHALRDSTWLRVTPRVLEPGWHWLPRPFLTVRRFPRGEQRLRFDVGLREQVTTPEGAAWAAAGVMGWQAEPAGLVRLASRSSGDVAADLLAPAVRAAAGRLLTGGIDSGAREAVQAALRAELAPDLSAAGLALTALGVDAVGPPRRVAAALGRRVDEAQPPGRLLLVGWDGADWNILDPLLERGEMPHLAGLLARGSRSRLRTVTPVLSPVVWTSVATGCLPDKHGIVDFLAVDSRTGARVPVTSNLRRVPALWTLLDRRGLASQVVAWWATWPAEPIRGAMVTDRLAYQLFGMGESLPETAEGATWPPDLYPRVARLRVRPEEIRDQEAAAFAPALATAGSLGPADGELLAEFKTVLAATTTYHDIALDLLRDGEPPVLTAVYYEASDTAAHLFMPFRPPLMDGVDPERARLWGDVVDAVYRDLDRRLGEVLAAAPADATVLLVSDHGFRTGENRPAGDARIGGGRAAEWHRKYGVLVAAGPGVRRGAVLSDPSVVDVAPTILALLGLPVTAAMDGRVLDEMLEPEFLAGHPLLLPAPGAAGSGPGDGAREDRPRPSAADEAIVERLRSLGYIGPEDVGSLAQSAVTAFNNRASILLAEGRPEEALAELEQGLQEAPGAVPLRVNRARALQLLDREEEALRELQQILEQEPTLVTVANLIANIHMQRGETGAAAGVLDRALTANPNSVELLITRGILAERLGRPEAALADYRRAAEIDPDSAEAPNNIGNLARARGRQALAAGRPAAAEAAFREAEEAYRAGLRADPDFIGTYNNLALIYQDTGRAELAMAMYQRALERAPEHAIVLNNLGSLYFAAGRLDEARDAFERAVAADPDYASAHNNLGATLGRLGLRDRELASYRKAVDLDPEYADGRHNLGLALLARGEEEAGERELLRAAELQPDYISAYASLAELYLGQGRAVEAVAILERALAVNSGLPGLHNMLGEAWLQRGDRERAEAAWRRSLKLAPDQPGLRERLEGEGGGAPGG